MKDNSANKNERFRDFSKIYNSIISKAITDFENNLDDEYKKFVGFRTVKKDKHFKECNNFFYNKREALKELYYGKRFIMDKNKKTDSNNYQFDFHKIVSIITCTLIRNKPFVFDVKKANEYKEKQFPNSQITDLDAVDPVEKKWIIDHILINYQFAFRVSMIVLWETMFYSFDNELEKFERVRNIMLSQKNLCIYIPNQNQETFENSLILDFAKRDLNNRSFDYFMYSVVLYQLEQYYIQNFGLTEILELKNEQP